jgi:hypothetical protein
MPGDSSINGTAYVIASVDPANGDVTYGCGQCNHAMRVEYGNRFSPFWATINGQIALQMLAHTIGHNSGEPSHIQAPMLPQRNRSGNSS